MKNEINIFIGITLDLQNAFGRMVISIASILKINKHVVYFHFGMFSQNSFKILKFLLWKYFTYLVRFITRHFFFETILNGKVSMISFSVCLLYIENISVYRYKNCRKKSIGNFFHSYTYIEYGCMKGLSEWDPICPGVEVNNPKVGLHKPKTLLYSKRTESIE